MNFLCDSVDGANPQRPLGLRRKVKDGGVVGGVGDEGSGHDLQYN